MKIRPKNFIIKAATGVRFSSANANGANWRALVFNNYRLHLLDLLAAYGEGDDYGDWLNEMQSRHASIYKKANLSGDWQSTAYENADVGKYQLDYRGGIGNDGNYLRYGSVQLRDSDRYDFNQTGIKTNQSTRYSINNPPSRTSGDFSREGYNYKVDNYYSAITDDRRLLGRKGDWDENSNEYKQWISDLNKTGWTMELDDSDNYYKLKRWTNLETNNPPSQNPVQQNSTIPANGGYAPVNHGDYSKFNLWNTLKKAGEGLRPLIPNILEAGRLAGNLINNQRVYDTSLKGIRPNLQQTYLTHRQVVGDEATKQAYYKRAAAGQTKAGRAFTSDADRLMAYMMEAKRIGDDLRAQGDLADNQEIRRTSDESNQHQWANTQRRTEVANRNTIELNQANAAKQNLLALKYTADWTSINNYLLGKETKMRLRLEEVKALDDLLWLLQELENLANDTNYLDLYKRYKAAFDKYYGKNPTEADKENFLALRKLYNQALLAHLKQMLLARKDRIYFGEKGTKISYKRKDDLLYKTARDAVEHFRKMSKMSDDSDKKSRTKPIKLSSHPKRTRKMQQGGVAPFTIFTPATLGGETTTSTRAGASSGSSSKSSKESTPMLDMIKELFTKVEGLPIDVNTAYRSFSKLIAQQEAFGDSLTNEDIAAMYMQCLQQTNQIKFNAEAYKQAKELVTKNDGLNEFAVDSAGRLVVQKEDGNIDFASWDEVKKSNGKLNPLKNNLLLLLRASSPNMINQNAILDIVSNGIGFNKIIEYVRLNMPNIGSSESTIEGYTKKESSQIKQGLELLAEAPPGDYKYTKYTKDLLDQANAALNYLMGILPRNMRTILEVNANLSGVTSKDLLGQSIKSRLSPESRLEFDAVTGKAAKKEGSSNSSSTDGDIKSNFLDLIQRDLIGTPRKFSMITKDGNIELYSLNSKYVSLLPNVTEDMSIDKMLSESKVGTILDSRLGITFGDLVVNPDNLKDIMFDMGGGATIVTLPCKWENGHKVVNFAIKDEFDQAIKEASKEVPIDYQDPNFLKVLSEKLKEKNLSSLTSGDSLDPNMFGHFMVVSGYTTDKVKFDQKSRYIEKIKNPDSSLEERLIKGLSTNKDKNDYEVDIDDKWWPFELTYDDVYRGSVFIPLNNDPVSAQSGWENDVTKLDEIRNLSEQYQNWNKLSQVKSTSSSLL